MADLAFWGIIIMIGIAGIAILVNAQMSYIKETRSWKFKGWRNRLNKGDKYGNM